MRKILSNLLTTAVFSDDGNKRYLLQKEWDDSKPRLAIIMLAPSKAADIELDSTTQLVLNNALRLGYGRVSIVNLFSTLGDFGLKSVEVEDAENIKAILQCVKDVDAIVYAPGVGKAKNKVFVERQKQVLTALKPYEGKLYCLTNSGGGARLQHPLSPAVHEWTLAPFRVNELLGEPVEERSAASASHKKRKKT